MGVARVAATLTFGFIGFSLIVAATKSEGDTRLIYCVLAMLVIRQGNDCLKGLDGESE